MTGNRTHLLLYAVDDLRKPLIQQLLAYPQINYSFADTPSELIAQIAQQPPLLILCRKAQRFSVPTGIPLIILSPTHEYHPAQFIHEPAIVDIVAETDLMRLPFIVLRELRKEHAIVRETHRLRTLVEHTPSGVVEVEIGSRQIRWSNQAMHRLFGYSAGEMQNLYIEDLHPNDIHTTIIDAFQRMSGGDETPLLHITCLRQDRSTFFCNIAPGGTYGNGQTFIFIFFTDVTSEYESLRTLQINAHRLELALRAANQGLYDLDLRSGRTVVTAEYATMLGYDPATFSETTQQWRERLHPHDADTVYQTFLDYLAGKIPEYRVEYRSRMQNGSWKWILSVGSIVERDEHGTPTRLLGTHTDISALKRLEFHERLRVQLFTSLLGGENVQTLMNILIQAFEEEQPDTYGAIILFDPKHLAISSVIGASLPPPLRVLLETDELLAPTNRWQPLFNRQRIILPILANNPAWHDVANTVQANGIQTLWAEPILGTGGLVIGTFTVWSKRAASPTSEDLILAQFISHLAGPIIEQHIISERLRLSEERYTLAERAVQDGVWDWDISNGITYLSSQWKALFGFDEDELPNTITTFFERIHPEDWPEVTKALDRHFAGLEPFHMEFRMRHRDNRYRWILARGEALRDANGNVTRMIGALSDITERKQLDERLHETQKLEALGLLTGGLAHDFNNLLGIIIGNLDMVLADWQYDPDVQQMIQASLHAALRGAELTKSLLAVARRQPLAPTAIELHQVLREFLPLIQVSLGSNVKVELLEQTTLPARADRAGLESALLNLVINSRDAMPQGGTLTIKVREQWVSVEDVMLTAMLAPGCYIVIDVIDTGNGMSPEVAKRAFEPFFTTKERGRGTGLGLAMVYGFARQSGGTAQIYSTSNLGTTVRLYLPCAQQTAPVEAPTVIPTARRQARILVVDDDPDLLRMTVSTLIHLGYTVLHANNGREALTLLQSEPVDLLLTDVVMPEMSGQELAKLAQQAFPTLKVLLMSGFAALQGAHIGDIPLIEKPFRASSLEVAVQQALEG
ncbi:MAG: histidine kinase [Chloroflexus sp.]|uniref:PAS domain-containing protein n=1 Tax=Chloroflexus sp. TaxID=1904827 RepID=UPI0021DDCB10|nr:PAS domain-containing protein [Chloroflexus sp.]GIV90742.1 MAG: histidine kinase [Chloroflexus sp.]